MSTQTLDDQGVPEEEAWSEEANLDEEGCLEAPDEEFGQEPDAPSTSIGQLVLDVAEEEWQRDFWVSDNQDDQQRIRTYFVEGLGWSEDRWDRASRKPDWCAAFASYCYREANNRANTQPLVEISARARVNAEVFEKVGRFLPAGRVFGRDRRLLAEIEIMPGPGDLIIWQSHVGLVREIDAQGNLLTIEGNTFVCKGGKNRWGVHPRKHSPKTSPKRWDKLLGFGLIG